MLKICQECGKEFESTNGMQKFCKGQHYRKCIVCGSLFPIDNYNLTAKDAKQTCSKKCSVQLRKQTNLDKYGGVAPACSKEVRDKMESTNLDRYGVKHPAQAQMFKDKSKETNLGRYGVEYYTQTLKSRQHMSDLWKNAEYSTDVRAKIATTNLDKYGVACSLANPYIRNKSRITYHNRTGYNYPLQNPEAMSKLEATNLARFGCKHPMQNEGIVNKFEQTNMYKYGCKNPMQNKSIKVKVQTTNVDKYGNACFLQSEEGKRKTRQSMMCKYGVNYFSQSVAWKSDMMLDATKINNLTAFRDNPHKFISNVFNSPPSIKELSIVLGIAETTAGALVTEFNLEDKMRYVYSYMEDDVFEYIKYCCPQTEIERNTHKIITPYEIDIYLPEYSIGIECNPTSTHNSSIDSFTNGPSNIDTNYHKMKTDICENNKIFLFHLFGYEWNHKQDIMKSMICNLLGKNDSKIYGRTTKVRLVDMRECSEFLNKNHIQGNANSSIRLGLYYDKELVSVMTFENMRNSIGTGNEDLSDCWELVRFCSKLNTTVVGGAGKLFSYFVKTYDPVRIRSFSDRAHTRGDLYNTLGFTELRLSDPGYVWVDSKTDIAYNRYNAQKQNIKKFLHDDSIDLSKTEKQIMEEHGYVQVFDSGTITWQWSK